MGQSHSTELTQAELHRLIHYNPDTGVFTWRVNRAGNAKAGAIAGCTRDRGYRHIHVIDRVYMAHRLAWFYVHGVWPPHEIDHIDHDPSNNAISNLRLATRIENRWNSKVQKQNSTGIKGATKTENGSYRVRICRLGKRYCLGTFKTSDEARKAYNDAAADLYGSYAGLA